MEPQSFSPGQQPQPTDPAPQPGAQPVYGDQPAAVPPAPVPDSPQQPQPQVFAPAQPAPLPQPEYTQPVAGAPQQVPPQVSVDQPGAPVDPQMPVTPFAQPVMPPTQVSGNGNSKVRLIAIVVGALLVLGALTFGVLALTGGKSGSKNPLSSLTGTKDVVSRPDGTLSLTPLIDPQKSIKNQTVMSKVGQQLNLSDGTAYMVVSVQRNFVSSDQYFQPAAGKEFVKVNLVVGNRGQTGTVYRSYSDFKLRNSVGGLQNAEYTSDTDLPDRLPIDSVQPGKQTKGAIVYEVDKGEKIQAITTTDKYKNYETNKEVTINSEVAL